MESGLLKGTLFFLCVVLAILLLMPKCPPTALAPLRARPATDSAPKGLRIESGVPAASKPASVAYPEGLDAEHLQYMIEVDPRFAAPKMASFPKDSPSADDALVGALSRLGYIEKQPDGRYGFSREGLLNVTGAVDQGSSWSVPIAKRAFVRATHIDCNGDNCRAEFQWQWQLNAIGDAMALKPQPMTGTATLNATDHHWLLNGINGLD